MKVVVEIYTQKPLTIKLDSWFKTALRANREIISGSLGYDEFKFLAIITSEKRVSGLGRECVNTLAAFPAGLGPIEAPPGQPVELPGVPEDLALHLETNLIPDPGTLAETLGLRLVNERGRNMDIPFCRPDVLILYEVRGSYTIPLAGLFPCKLFPAVLQKRPEL